VGVGLLGARITANQIAGLGMSALLTVLAAVVVTLLGGLVLGRLLGLSPPQRVLAAGAVAICGASAALALSAVLPREKDDEHFTLMVVVTVTVMSTMAMVLYPLVAQALHLPPELAGLFLGATIHDVAQVAGAGYTLSPVTGDCAILVKLCRVALLSVLVVVVSLAFKSAAAPRRSTAAHAGRMRWGRPLVPWFLWLFVCMALCNSLGLLPGPQQAALDEVSRACLVLAIAALGVKTSFRQLARAGWRPVVFIALETLGLAGFVLLVIRFGQT
jgi:uncharacterized integral membrane protein (TIGR00698 family)